jgi:DNA recombination protein RmuC
VIAWPVRTKSRPRSKLTEPAPSAPALILCSVSVLYLLLGVFIGAAGAVLLLRVRLITQTQMTERFNALAGDALDENMRRLSELARAELATGQAGARGELEQRRQAIEQLVKPLAEQLDGLERERTRQSAALSEQVRSLATAQEALRRETGLIASVLRQSGSRGQWGQMQLRRVIELAGMLNHCDFSEQSSITGADERRLRPDLIVHLPGGREVPIDAKAPTVLLDGGQEGGVDEAARSRLLTENARRLRGHVRALADKAYWSEISEAVDFVVLFLPGEHIYSALFEVDPELIEDAMARRVLIATPTTLLALLHAVAFGWQQEQVAASAREVSELGGELYRRLVRFSSLLGNVGKRLGSAVSAYNEAVGSYDGRVLPGARRLSEQGVPTAGQSLEPLDQITLAARTVAGEGDNDNDNDNGGSAPEALSSR